MDREALIGEVCRRTMEILRVMEFLERAGIMKTAEMREIPQNSGRAGQKSRQEEICESGTVRPEKDGADTEQFRNSSTAVFFKKAVTERDLMDLAREAKTQVIIGARTIVTDLAKEYAKKHQMEICRNTTQPEYNKTGT